MNDAGSDTLDTRKLLRLYGTLAIQGLAHRVHYPTDDCLAHRYLGDATGAFDGSALLDVDILAHDGATHVVFFQVEGEAIDGAVLGGKLQQLHEHALLHPVDAGNTVTNSENGASLAQFNLLVIVLDLFPDNLTDFFGPDFHRLVSPLY